MRVKACRLLAVRDMLSAVEEKHVLEVSTILTYIFGDLFLSLLGFYSRSYTWTPILKKFLSYDSHRWPGPARSCLEDPDLVFSAG